jgi:hypothetical protein
MTRSQGKEHTMKRIAVTLGVATVMGVFASAAAGSNGQSVKQAVVQPRPGKPALVLQTRQGSQSGTLAYRLGNTGLWME